MLADDIMDSFHLLKPIAQRTLSKQAEAELKHLSGATEGRYVIRNKSILLEDDETPVIQGSPAASGDRDPAQHAPDPLSEYIQELNNQCSWMQGLDVEGDCRGEVHFGSFKPVVLAASQKREPTGRGNFRKCVWEASKSNPPHQARRTP